MDNTQGHEVMTMAEVAALLRCSEMTVRRLLVKGGIPGHRMGSRWRFIRSELLEWLKKKSRGISLFQRKDQGRFRPGTGEVLWVG